MSTKPLFPVLSALNIETERLRIRPVADTDLITIYAMHSVHEVNTYLPYKTWQNWDDAKDWFARVQHRRGEQSSEQYVLVRKQDDKVVGSCIVFNFNDNDRSLEFGYVLSKAAWGKGYMFEAMTHFLAGLKHQAAVSAVIASVGAANTPSIRLLNKLGFKHIGNKKSDDHTQLELMHLSLS